MTTPESKLLRPKEVSQILGRSRKWLWEMVRRGEFPPPERRNCRCIHWPQEVVDAYRATHPLKQRRKPEKPAPKREIGLRLVAALRARVAGVVCTPMPNRMASRIGSSDAHAAAGNNEHTCARGEVGADGGLAEPGQAREYRDRPAPDSALEQPVRRGRGEVRHLDDAHLVVHQQLTTHQIPLPSAA
jgi:predicted DNA-binding transcriptional regulator AlpA